jgi:hypothetical protein
MKPKILLKYVTAEQVSPFNAWVKIKTEEICILRYIAV